MIRPTQDNVVIRLEPEENVTASGVIGVKLKRGARDNRIATVLASGPGYYGRPTFLHPEGLFHPNELKEGDRILVDALAGQDYTLDINAPRHNKGIEFEKLLGERGEFRIIREQEALCIVEEVAEAAE